QQAVKDATPQGRIRLRHVVARHALDGTGVLGEALANHLTGHLLQTAGGRTGMMHAEKMQGTDPETTAAFDLRCNIIARLGYTVGQEVERNRVPPAYWKRAAKIHNVLAARLQAGGEKVVTVTGETIRAWCSLDSEPGR